MRVSFSGRIKINKSKFNKCLRILENRGVAQLVARMVRDHEVVGSNPVASTSKKSYFASKIALFLF